MTGFRNLLNGIFHDASLSKSYSIGADKAGFVRGVFGSPQHSRKINVDTKLKFISYMMRDESVEMCSNLRASYKSLSSDFLDN